jgi:hypothetical protein
LHGALTKAQASVSFHHKRLEFLVFTQSDLRDGNADVNLAQRSHPLVTLIQLAMRLGPDSKL